MPANARLLMEISRDLEVLEARQEADDETGVVEDAPFNPEDI
ncbi:hypothetical protein [Microbacterium sp. Ru50]|nr:hypothetical protein [Microbacterium sp. Ru50]